MKNVEIKSIGRDSSNGMMQMVKGNLGILIGFTIMCIALAVITDSFTTTRGIFNVMRQISVNVFLACDMTMVILIRGIDLSVGSIITASGCLSAGFITNNGIPSAAAITLTIAIGTAVEAASGVIISNTKIPPFIVTLAVMNIGRGLARTYTKAIIILVNDDLFIWTSNGKIFSNIPIQIVFMIIIVVIMAIILNRIRSGRNIHTIEDNRQAAECSNVNAKRITFQMFTLSGLFASCTGALSATRIFSGQFSVGDGTEMNAISVVVLGGTSMTRGVERISGTIIGCLVIGVLNNGMNLLGVDSSWQYVVKGLVVLLTIHVDYIEKEKSKG